VSAPAGAPPVGIVTGLASEARLVRRALAHGEAQAGITVACAGPGPEHARAAVHGLIAGGAAALASVGLAGGLKPSAWPGLVVVARRVVTADGAGWDTDTEWRARLVAALIGDDDVLEALLCGADAPVLSAADKAALFAATGAHAVDTESHAVAAAAHEAGVPFAALRAVADPAGRTVPEGLARSVRADGSIAALAALGWAAARPLRLGLLVACARDARRAMQSLRRVLAATGAVGLVEKA
jgi:adenosylhomocysteine nucleosidase